MTDSRSEFNTRLRVLGRKHRAIERGSRTQMRDDGLIVVRPDHRTRHSSVPMRALLFIVLGLFLFKGLMLASLSEIDYTARLETLSTGTSIEKVGALLMQPDPVSLLFARVWSDTILR